MQVRIENTGIKVERIPTRNGVYIFWPGMPEILTNPDPTDIEVIRNFAERQFSYLKIEVIEEKPKAEPEAMSPSPDLSHFKIWELRSAAAKLGIEGYFTMKKAELIKKLEERNATRS